MNKSCNAFVISNRHIRHLGCVIIEVLVIFNFLALISISIFCSFCCNATGIDNFREKSTNIELFAKKRGL